jgi:hypothetical protein
MNIKRIHRVGALTIVGCIAAAVAISIGFEIWVLDSTDAWPWVSVLGLRTGYLCIFALSTVAGLVAFAGAAITSRAPEALPQHQPDIVEGGVDRALAHVVQGAHD